VLGRDYPLKKTVLRPVLYCLDEELPIAACGEQDHGGALALGLRVQALQELLSSGNCTPGDPRYRATRGGEVSGKREGAGALQIAAAHAAVK
jgi:hypothetical protein